MSNAEILMRIELLIDSNFKIHKDSQFYADEINMTLKRLNRFLKQRRGLTVAKLIDDRLHSEAIRLLLDTDLAIKYISYELEYCDPGHFTRVFKKIKGITPVKFRRMHEN